MSVVIEPSEQLEFHGPFSRISKESLHVKNPGNEAVIFKVKTTAPKQYCVRPNAGRIEPNSEIEVQIILQPIKEELPADYKCKDKFLVQTAPINSNFEQQDITSMWSHIETTERASMHQHKIKCVFIPALKEEENNSTEESFSIVNEEKNVAAPIPEQANSTGFIASSPPSPPPTTTEPVPVQSTSSNTNNTLQSTTRDIPAVPVHKEPIPSTHAPIPTESIVPETVAAKVLPEAKSIVSKDDSKDKELKDALEKIKRLEQQLSELQKEEGIRARNNNNNGGRKLASTVQPLDAVHQHLAALEKPRSDEGYPPQVVLIVAALVFIFTYLFF